MNAIILLLCVVSGDDGFRWQVSESPGFQWAITEQKGGDPASAVVAPGGSGEERTASLPAPEPSLPRTTVCQCQGHNERVCLCLKARQQCHCSRTSGSVWALNDKGQATHKTGAKADPRRETQPVARGAAPAASVPTDDTVPRKRADGKWWWKGPDGTWFGTATLTDGQTYLSGTNSFVFKGGKMEWKSPMAVQIPQPTGHWEKRCYGSYCRMEWVPN